MISDTSLSGYSVLITRPSDQCGELARRISEAGGQPLVAPMLGIRAIDDPQGAMEIVKRIREFDTAVFVSRNAVEYAFSRLGVTAEDLQSIEVYSVGLGTAAQLKSHDVTHVQTPKSAFSTEGLLDMPNLAPGRIAQKRVVIIGGRDGRDVLAKSLKSRAAHVELCEVYERFIPDTCLKQVLTENRGSVPDIAIVTSLAALNNLAEKIADEGLEDFYDVPLLVVSARIAEEVVKLGFTSEPLIVENPGDGRIMTALAEWVDGGL